MAYTPPTLSGIGIRRHFPKGPLIQSLREMRNCHPSAIREPIVPVRSARVALANYDALVHDFPGLRSRQFQMAYEEFFCGSCMAAGELCSCALDKWILDNAAFLSLQQSVSDGVNSPIDCGPPVERAYRPMRYGRAFLVPVEEKWGSAGARFLDLKGVGVAPNATATQTSYTNGLEYLGVALGDYFYAWLLDRIFRRSEPGYSTVPVYAVIDLGFDIVGGWHGTAPAAATVRRAHSRHPHGYEVPLSGTEEETVRLHIEMILRSYGLSTAAPSLAYELSHDGTTEILCYGGQPISTTTDRARKKAEQIAQVCKEGPLEIINLQLANTASWKPRIAQLVDFGHVHARERFNYPLGSPAYDSLLGVARTIKPGDAGFVQPVDGIAVDHNLFRRSSVNAFGFYAAQAFRDKRYNRKDIELLLRLACVQALRGTVRTNGIKYTWANRCRPNIPHAANLVT